MNPTELILTDDQLNEIAQDLDCGLRVFIHKHTRAILSIPDFDDLDESEFWEDIQQELEENSAHYYEIDRPRSNDSFIFMADFTDQFPNSKFKDKLDQALNRRK